MTISTLETVLKQMPAMDTQDVIAAAHLILKAQAVASKESVELHAVYCYNTCSHYRPGHSQLGSVWIGSAHTNPLRPCYTNPCQIVGPCYKFNFQNDCNQHLQMWTKASNLPPQLQSSESSEHKTEGFDCCTTFQQLCYTPLCRHKAVSQFCTFGHIRMTVI